MSRAEKLALVFAVLGVCAGLALVILDANVTHRRYLSLPAKSAAPCGCVCPDCPCNRSRPAPAPPNRRRGDLGDLKPSAN